MKSFEEKDVDQKASSQYCGVPPDKAFDCYYKHDWYEGQVVARWLLIIAAIALAVLVHALIPLFG